MATNPLTFRSALPLLVLLFAVSALLPSCRSANQQLAADRWEAQQHAADETTALKVEPARATNEDLAADSPARLAFDESTIVTQRPDPAAADPNLVPATRAVSPMMAPAVVHSAPDPAYTQLAVMDAGVTVRITGRRELTPSGLWHEVELPDLDYNGWILGRALVSPDDPILDQITGSGEATEADGGTADPVGGDL